MSRTLRAFPQRNRSRSSLKWYGGAPPSFIKRTGRSLFPIYKIDPNAPVQEVDSYSWSPESQYARGYRLVGFKEYTEAEHLERLAKDQLYWCKKNKTCRRQRKNGVRLTKRIAARQQRAQLKQDTKRLVQHLEDLDAPS